MLSSAEDRAIFEDLRLRSQGQGLDLRSQGQRLQNVSSRPRTFSRNPPLVISHESPLSVVEMISGFGPVDNPTISFNVKLYSAKNIKDRKNTILSQHCRTFLLKKKIK